MSDKSKYLISLKGTGGSYQRHEVPKAVYEYIIRLEAAINDPNGTCINTLRSRYPGRFPHGYEQHTVI